MVEEESKQFSLGESLPNPSGQASTQKDGETLTDQQRKAEKLQQRIEEAKEAQERVYQNLRGLQEPPLTRLEMQNSALLLELGRLLSKQGEANFQAPNLAEEIAEKTGITPERAKELLKRCSSIRYFLSNLTFSFDKSAPSAPPDLSFLERGGILGFREANNPSEASAGVLIALLSIGVYYKISEVLKKQQETMAVVDSILSKHFLTSPKFLREIDEIWIESPSFSIEQENNLEELARGSLDRESIHDLLSLYKKLSLLILETKKILREQRRVGVDLGILFVNGEMMRDLGFERIFSAGQYLPPSDFFKGDLGKLGFIILESPFQPYVLLHEYKHFEYTLLNEFQSPEKDLLKEIESYLFELLPRIPPSYYDELTLSERLQEKFERALAQLRLKERFPSREDYWRELRRLLLQSYFPKAVFKFRHLPRYARIKNSFQLLIGLMRTIDTVKRLYENGFSLPAIETILLEAKGFKDVYQYNRLSNKELKQIAQLKSLPDINITIDDLPIEEELNISDLISNRN